MKALYYGDNRQFLRDSIATESVDLIYLDPPFNSNARAESFSDPPDDRMRTMAAQKAPAAGPRRRRARDNVNSQRGVRELRCLWRETGADTTLPQRWTAVRDAT